MSSIKPLKINIDGIISEINKEDLVTVVATVIDGGGHQTIPLTDHNGRFQIISEDITGILIQILREQKKTNLYLAEMLGNMITNEDIDD
jgi:hypothetical protein